MFQTSNNDIIFVVADTHFNHESSVKDLTDFFFFLEKVRKEASKLFLLGDIFDFYFEYKTVIPKMQFSIFCELQRTSTSGVEIHYWAGNHDFWLGEFLKELKIITHLNPEIITSCGNKILIEHGNELDSKNVIKIIIKTKLSRALYSYIHPDLGINLARRISKLSRMRSEKCALNLNHLIKYAQEKFRSEADAILMGHFHKPYLYKENDKCLVILGDWSNYRSFGIISNGKISLNRFNHSPR